MLSKYRQSKREEHEAQKLAAREAHAEQFGGTHEHGITIPGALYVEAVNNDRRQEWSR